MGKETREVEMEMEMEVKVIHSWSAPRSLSTSLMYSFAQRDDMEVVDEPFYAEFLRQTGTERPYRDELLSKTEPDVNKLVKDVLFGPGKKEYRYCKQIAYECPPGIVSDLLKKGKHFILIRNPLHILPSFHKVSPASFLELGFPGLLTIYTELSEHGAAPPVINAEDLQENPEVIRAKFQWSGSAMDRIKDKQSFILNQAVVLRGLCEDLGIPFQASMLRWEAGPKEYDGVWAPWWYKGVHKSTCFLKPRKYPPAFPFELYDLLEQSMPFYHMLDSKVRRTSSSSTSPANLLLPNDVQPVLPIADRTLVWVGTELVPIGIAKVHVFDCALQEGHVVLEGLSVYKGKVFKLNEHLDRILYTAKALGIDRALSKELIKEAIFSTVISNGMSNSTAHIKLALICHKKATYVKFLPHGDLHKCTLIVLAERKEPSSGNSAGMKLRTRATLLNSSTDHEGSIGELRDAIIMDKDGFLSKINFTNIFMAKDGKIFTAPMAKRGPELPSITYMTVIELINGEKLTLREQTISLSEFHAADEVWAIGTMGELTPIIAIDGCVVGQGHVGPITKKLLEAYEDLTEESGEAIPADHGA